MNESNLSDSERERELRTAAEWWLELEARAPMDEATRQRWKLWSQDIDHVREVEETGAFVKQLQGWNELASRASIGNVSDRADRAARSVVAAASHKRAANRPAHSGFGTLKSLCEYSALVGVICLMVFDRPDIVEDLAPTESPSASSFDTRTGETLHIALSRDLLVQIGAQTTLTVNHRGTHWVVAFKQGEATFSDRRAYDSLQVTAGGGSIRAKGASFNLYKELGSVSVTALEGHVAVIARASKNGSISESDPIVLNAGEELTYHEYDTIISLAPVDIQAATAWHRGRLEYLQAPLLRVITDVNRYSARQITLDPLAKDLIYTGSVILSQVDDWTQVLPSVLPVRVETIDATHLTIRLNPGDCSGEKPCVGRAETRSWRPMADG